MYFKLYSNYSHECLIFAKVQHFNSFLPKWTNASRQSLFWFSGQSLKHFGWLQQRKYRFTRNSLVMEFGLLLLTLRRAYRDAMTIEKAFSLINGWTLFFVHYYSTKYMRALIYKSVGVPLHHGNLCGFSIAKSKNLSMKHITWYVDCFSVSSQYIGMIWKICSFQRTLMLAFQVLPLGLVFIMKTSGSVLVCFTKRMTRSLP